MTNSLSPTLADPTVPPVRPVSRRRARTGACVVAVVTFIVAAAGCSDDDEVGNYSATPATNAIDASLAAAVLRHIHRRDLLHRIEAVGRCRHRCTPSGRSRQAARSSRFSATGAGRSGLRAGSPGDLGPRPDRHHRCHGRADLGVSDEDRSSPELGGRLHRSDLGGRGRRAPLGSDAAMGARRGRLLAGRRFAPSVRHVPGPDPEVLRLEPVIGQCLECEVHGARLHRGEDVRR